MIWTTHGVDTTNSAIFFWKVFKIVSHCLIVPPSTLENSSFKNINILYLSHSLTVYVFSFNMNGAVVSEATIDKSIDFLFEYHSVSIANIVSSH